MFIEFAFLKWVVLGVAIGRLFGPRPSAAAEPADSGFLAKPKAPLQPTPLVPTSDAATAALDVVLARLTATGSTPEATTALREQLVPLINRSAA